MAKKIKLELILNEGERKLTFSRRKKGIMKKLHELRTLCDVQVCAVVYDPWKDEPAVVWPSLAEVGNMINMFKSLPEMQQQKKKLTHEEYLKYRIGKMQEKLRKVRKQNRRLEMTKLMNECLRNKDFHDQSMLNLEDLQDLSALVDEKMKLIDERIETLMRQRALPQSRMFP